MKYVYAAVACLLPGFCLPGTAQKLPEPPHDCPRLIESYGGQADPVDVNLPDVSGRVLIYYWSQLEPKQGKFDFSTMDRSCAPEHNSQAGNRKGE